MRVRFRTAVVAGAAAAAVAGFATPAFATPAFAAPASASTTFGSAGARHAVFVQTDNTTGNHIVAYHRAPDGTLRQAATCWVAPAGPFLFASNAGSANVSGFTSSAGGQLGLLGATGADAGTVDASAAAGGRFLYVQAGGAGIVDEFGVSASGSLTRIGSVTVPGAAGGEGIVAF